MTILFHADDLGITPGASKAILSAWTAGALDGFSVIANGDGLEAVRVGLEQNLDRPARIAVHFNLTEGRASAPRERIPRLVDDRGHFRRGFGGYFARWLFGSSASWNDLLAQAEIECRAQIQAVRAACPGRAIRALDGHNHIHMIPGLFGAAARAAKAEEIAEIRVSREPFYLSGPFDWLRPFWWLNLIKHVLLRLLSRRAAPVARAEGLRFPRFLIGVLYTGRMTGTRAARGIRAAKEGEGDVEVVFHVGRSTPAEAGRWTGQGYAAFHLSPWREIEFEELLKLRKADLTRPTGSST